MSCSCRVKSLRQKTVAGGIYPVKARFRRESVNFLSGLSSYGGREMR